MSKETDYTAKRQLRAITSRGKDHNSTISGVGIFPEPLFDSIATRTKKERKKKAMYKKIENVTISIDLDVKQRTHSDNFLDKMMNIAGVKKVEKDFELVSTAEKVLRALAKAKFKNVNSIELDQEELYYNPTDFYDSNDAIDIMIKEIKDNEGRGSEIYAELTSADFEDCMANVIIKKTHMVWYHDILIMFDGQLPGEMFLRIINYLEENLEIEDIEKEWERAN